MKLNTSGAYTNEIHAKLLFLMENGKWKIGLRLPPSSRSSRSSPHHAKTNDTRYTSPPDSPDFANFTDFTNGQRTTDNRQPTTPQNPVSLAKEKT